MESEDHSMFRLESIQTVDIEVHSTISKRYATYLEISCHLHD